MPVGDYPHPHCTCGPWRSVVPPPPCPMHSAPCHCRAPVCVVPQFTPPTFGAGDPAAIAKYLREIADTLDPSKDTK